MPVEREPGERPDTAAAEPMVLLVDDEESVRALLEQALTQMGCAVATAADGVQALARAREQPPSLLITDVDMPNLGGPALAARLRRDDPGLPVLLVSGQPRPTVPSALEGPDTAFLRKPFSLGDLSRAVRALTGLGDPPAEDNS